MTYSEWLKSNDPIDAVVAAVLPPLEELGGLTHREIEDRYGGAIAQAGQALGIGLTPAEIAALVDRVAGVEEWPAATRADYDRHL